MKSRLFLISLLLTGSLSAMACWWNQLEPEKHWIFYLGYPTEGNWQLALDKQLKEENITFWHKYVGGAVPRETVEKAIYEVFLLNENTTDPFFALLLKKRDSVALRYWMSLKTQDPRHEKEMRWRQSAWWYPESDSDGKQWDNYPLERDPKKQKIDLSIMKVRELNEECMEQCPNRDIRNRYVLQLLRKYFYRSEYENCVKLWEKQGGGIPQSALRTQCLNYYGGALLRLGRRNDAATVYAGIGYFNIFLHYDPEVLREVCRQQPDNSGLEFMVQQFVNAYFDHPKPEKAAAFNKLAEEMVRNSECHNPALWKSAQAAIAYTNRNTSEAMRLLAESEKMRGSDMVKENIRMMRLLFNSTRTDNDSLYEAALYPDLQWLTGLINADIRKTDTNNYEESFYGTYLEGLHGETFLSNLALHRVKVLRRVVYLGAVPHFERIGEQYKSIAFLNLYNEVFNDDKKVREYARNGQLKAFVTQRGTVYLHPPVYRGTYIRNYWNPYPHWFGFKEIARKIYSNDTWQLNYDYNSDFFRYMDSSLLEDVLQYVAFLQSGGKTPMEKYLIRNSYRDTNYYYELIGTKYMRRQQFAAAARYFRKVSDKFLKTQNIAEYLNAGRNPFAEKWITNREKGVYALPYDPVKEFANNPTKLNFCHIMLRLRETAAKGKTAEQRAHASYAYAVGLFQSNCGHAWALNHYSDNCYLNMEYLTESPELYLDDEEESAPDWRELYREKMLKQVDLWANNALKYDKDRLFTLKCKLLHSKRRNQLKEKVVRKYAWSDDFTYTDEVFNKEVQKAFCDNWQDHRK